MHNQYYGSYMGIPGIVRTYKKYHTAEVIIEEVSQYFGVRSHKVHTRTRSKEVVLARHFSMLMMLEYTRLSLKNIGVYFKRHHSTVIHARVTLTGYIKAKAENKYKVDYDNIKSRLDAI